MTYKVNHAGQSVYSSASFGEKPQAGRTPLLDQLPPKSIECLMRGTQRDSARSY